MRKMVITSLPGIPGIFCQERALYVLDLDLPTRGYIYIYIDI